MNADAATLEITDNDVILSVDPATVSEGASGTPITVTGTLERDLGDGLGGRGHDGRQTSPRSRTSR